MQTPVQLIVGLGNPGPEYVHTRHNAGEDFVAKLAAKLSISLTPTPKFFGFSGRAIVAGHELRLLVPSTYMNRSGQAVGALSQFYKIPPQAILVAHDELDLPPGCARLKQGGGHGGHNGLKDIIAALGNNRDFGRLRLGIGHPGAAPLVTGYVLQRAPVSEREKLDQAMDSALAVLDDLIKGDWNRAMHQLHSAAK